MLQNTLLYKFSMAYDHDIFISMGKTLDSHRIQSCRRQALQEEIEYVKCLKDKELQGYLYMRYNEYFAEKL